MANLLFRNPNEIDLSETSILKTDTKSREEELLFIGYHDEKEEE